MAVVSPERLRDDIVGLLHRGLGVRDYSLAAARALGRAVPFDGVCVLTLDPATLLPTGEVVENGLPPAASARMAEIEFGEPDFNKFTALAAAGWPTASLSQATGGDLDRSRRHREVKRPHGFGDELRAALAGDSTTWGGLTLLREAGRDNFTPGHARLVGSLSEYLAEGLRRAILVTALTAGPARGEAGLLLLADDNSIELANPAAEAWLAELGADDGTLPGVIAAVASRARAAAAAPADTHAIARARVHAASGQWLLVRGSMLGDRAAVILEAAGPPELASLIADAYGLTARERAVTQLVAQGLPTAAIAGRLHLSPYTVRDHLKSIFEKAGVGSRGELVGRLFFEHYAPRLV